MTNEQSREQYDSHQPPDGKGDGGERHTVASITAREIDSQPAVWARAMETPGDASTFFGRPGERVLILGCGTSAFVAESLAALREGAGLGLTDAAYASEWRPGRTYDRVVVVSRSGTTSEVATALALVPAGVTTALVTAVHGSPIEDAVTQTLVLEHADEASVVQTRFPTTVLVLGRLAFGAGLAGLVPQAERALAAPLPFAPAEHDHFVFLGSGWTYGLAQEAALKVREAAQAWSESYPMLDYRHGPIAVAHPGTLVTILGPADPDLVGEIEATGAVVQSSDADPLVQLVQAQRLAVALAESRGLSPDTPRHLSRSVVLK